MPRQRKPRAERPAATDEITTLARRAATGDRAATQRFVEATIVDVWRLCAHLVDAPSADDLAQSTFERALPALPRFRGDASARTWLLAIARNTCADELRHRTRRRRLDAEATVVAAAEPVPSCAGASALDDLVARLAPERREAFVLTQVLGMRYEEAAEVQGCPVGTVRSRVARARAELVAWLDDAERDVAAVSQV